MMVRARGLRQEGFTLLEAIVAMVLVGTTGLALFGWISASISSLHRVQEVNAQSEATTNVLEFMDRVNPMLTPEGRAGLGAYSIEWRARPVGLITDGADYPFGVSLYQLALYETEVLVNGAGSKRWFEMRLKQVGFKQVRSVEVAG